MQPTAPSVLILGAGPVGLGAALELARSGVRSAVGEQLGLIESRGFEGPGREVSLASPIMSPQELIEAILLDAVRASGMVRGSIRDRSDEARPGWGLRPRERHARDSFTRYGTRGNAHRSSLGPGRS